MAMPLFKRIKEIPRCRPHPAGIGAESQSRTSLFPDQALHLLCPDHLGRIGDRDEAVVARHRPAAHEHPPRGLDHGHPFPWPVLVPFAFTGELAYRLDYFLANIGDVVPTFGRQFGLSLEHLSLPIPATLRA